jgi:hypothetical protein
MDAYLAPLEAIPVQVDASWTGENFLNSNSEQCERTAREQRGAWGANTWCRLPPQGRHALLAIRFLFLAGGTYVHLVVLGALASFAMAWSIGEGVAAAAVGNT